MRLVDEKFAQIAKENKNFKPKPVKSIPYIIGDNIEGGHLKSMADGKIYDSKSKYYQSLKEAGCVIVGNEKQESTKSINEITQKDVKNAIERLKSR